MSCFTALNHGLKDHLSRLRHKLSFGRNTHHKGSSSAIFSSSNTSNRKISRRNIGHPLDAQRPDPLNSLSELVTKCGTAEEQALLQAEMKRLESLLRPSNPSGLRNVASISTTTLEPFPPHSSTAATIAAPPSSDGALSDSDTEVELDTVTTGKDTAAHHAAVLKEHGLVHRQGGSDRGDGLKEDLSGVDVHARPAQAA